ncbi:MAG: hypothetical protein MK100_02480 [Phycisphaerales bacterium]|nr:hypothetical protein [Phycisphaerales bacterium]
MAQLPPDATAANRLGFDYALEANRLGPPKAGIIDVHTHLRDPDAVAVFAQAAEQFGVQEVWSMSPLEQLNDIRSVLGDKVQFIAQPNFRSDDLLDAMGEGYLRRIQEFHQAGARLVKFWAAPRAIDLAEDAGQRDLMDLDGPLRQAQMQLACELGMGIMTHVGDPDTWFQTVYADRDRYGTKEDHYAPLERSLERYPTPWIAAHMGGWPERLDLLDGLLERHSNLHLDTSATKWMVRELSRHPTPVLTEFLTRWKGRILFGSDIVVQGDHLRADSEETGRAIQATNREEAFELYASRYFALRSLFESDYVGESPIADPDLNRIDPQRYGPMDAPMLKGHQLPAELLETIYRNAAADWRDKVDAFSSIQASS